MRFNNEHLIIIQRRLIGGRKNPPHLHKALNVGGYKIRTVSFTNKMRRSDYFARADKLNLYEMTSEQTDLITKKEGYEAMLYAIKAYWENSGSNDLTDILSGGEYWLGTDKPADSAFWSYWIDAIEKVRKDGPMFKTLTN